HFQRHRPVLGLRRQRSAYRSSFNLEELEVILDEGDQLALVFKDLSPKAMSASAREAKPPFLYDPMREIDVYRCVLAPTKLSTARYYGMSVDEAAGRSWLFLENVAGLQLHKAGGGLALWHRVAQWLAGLHLHASFESTPTCRWLRYDRDYFRL